jgi:hypothetical protein
VKTVCSVQTILNGVEDGEKPVLVYMFCFYCTSADCIGRIYRKTFCTSVYLDSVESAIIFRAETLRMTVVIMFYCYFQFIPWFKNDSKVFIL